LGQKGSEIEEEWWVWLMEDIMRQEFERGNVWGLMTRGFSNMTRLICFLLWIKELFSIVVFLLDGKGYL
jgi:hypothetical protein